MTRTSEQLWQPRNLVAVQPRAAYSVSRIMCPTAGVTAGHDFAGSALRDGHNSKSGAPDFECAHTAIENPPLSGRFGGSSD